MEGRTRIGREEPSGAVSRDPRSSGPLPHGDLTPAKLLALQRSSGNRAVGAFLRRRHATSPPRLMRVVRGDVLTQSIGPDWARALTDDELAQQLEILRGAASGGDQSAQANLAVVEQEAVTRQPHGSSPVRPQAPVSSPRQSSPAQSSTSPAAPASSAPAGGPGSGQQVRVQVLTAAEYATMTGVDASQLPERRFVSAGAAGLGPAAVMTRPPPVPFAANTTGVLWDGRHAVDVAVVDGTVTARGFRAGFLRHAASAAERAPLPLIGRPLPGGPFTTSLNRGTPGSYANDWFYMYMPDATLVTRNDATRASASELTEAMSAAGPGMEGVPYRFSPPPPGTPAYESAFGAGPCLGGNNCVNVPIELHEQALGGPHVQVGDASASFDVARGPQSPGGPLEASAGGMDAWVGQSDEWFAARGLTRQRIGPTMLARGASGVVRVGGTVLMVYGAVQSIDRIADAQPGEQRTVVVSEEAGSWTGGWVGSALASAMGGMFVCSETGPGAFVCGLVFGVVGGVTGQTIGTEAGHEVGDAINTLSNATPQQLTEGAVQMFGTPDERRQYYEDQEFLQQAGL